ncbi:MAG: SDR family NAD(P)-dependent oxidoreductase, partial [Gemmatimonadaceae bacterium]|nr:SDR family NAD(P)-dependent oxidoreductase [Gloeobacterales cyanobacterium ES-bin-141]
HLEDIVGALTFALERRLVGVFNLVGDDPLTRRALLEYLFNLHGLNIPSWDGIVASSRPYNARVSNTKLKAAGYRLRHPQI